MKRIPLFTSQLTDKDIAEGERVLRRNYQLTKGEEVVEFERALAEYVGRKYCVVVNSGCSALRIVFSFYYDSDEYWAVQKFTYHGVHEIIKEMEIATDKLPVENETYGLGLEIPDNVILTHIAGFPAKYTDEIECCLMIEDACQGFGSSIEGRKIGTWGDAAILSFCQNKIITTGGEGGAILTDNRSFFMYANKYREYNYRMSSQAAAIGLSQLSRIDEIIEERRRQAHILNKVYPCALKELPGHYQTYQMYLVKPEVEVPDYVETKMRFDGCELLKEIPLALSQVVAAQSEQK
jgi:perosamine synthetase